MKKKKAVTINEKFFKYTGKPKDYLEAGDVDRLRQISPLDYPNVYSWRVDYISHKRITGENPHFNSLCSTDYERGAGDNPADDWNEALKWINKLYNDLEEINEYSSCASPLTIFGKMDKIEVARTDFDNMMDDFRKKHPEVLIGVNFDWNWIG